ncbi:MAG: ThuA domain-containing protein [Luteolibacter sp.]
MKTPSFIAITLALAGVASAQEVSGKKSAGIPLFQKGYEKEWYVWQPSTGPTANWSGRVKMREDGVIHVLDIPVTDIPEEFGYFATNDDYRNYRLDFEYKWGEKKFAPRKDKKRDSGVIYHMWGADQIWPRCMECQVQEGDTGDFHLLWKEDKPSMEISVKPNGHKGPDGRRVFDPAGEKLIRQTGSVQRFPEMDHLTEWNRVTVEVSGNSVRHLVNGTLNNAAENLLYPDGKPLDSGKIALQVEGAEMFYRNVTISPITWPADHAPFSVLVFSKTAAFRHDSIPDGVDAIRRLGETYGFSVDHTEDSKEFTAEKLAKYKVVIFLSTTGDVLDDPQQQVFEKYIHAGGGFAGIHAASDTEYDWPWFGQLVGAYFAGHPKQQTADLHLVDENSTSTAMLPRKWTRYDEWYNFKKGPDDKKVHVLMRIDEKSYKGGKMGENHPMSWQHEFDGGRAWFTALGHTKESFTEPLFLMHLLGGIQYAAGIPAAK